LRNNLLTTETRAPQNSAQFSIYKGAIDKKQHDSTNIFSRLMALETAKKKIEVPEMKGKNG